MELLPALDNHKLAPTKPIEGFRCLGNHVLLQLIKPGGMIELPQNYTPDQTRARVIATGPGILLHTGDRVKCDVEVGECVLMMGQALEVKLEGWDDVFITDAKTIVGVVLPTNNLPMPGE